MKRLLLFAVLFIALEAEAQVKSINPGRFLTDWNEGMVVFSTGDTVNCNIRFNQSIPNGILQVKEGGKILTLPAKDVRSFSFYDLKRKRIRKFYSIPASFDEERNRQFFMECLYADRDFSILRCRTIGVPYDYMNYSRFISRSSRISKQYVLDVSTGEVLQLNKENVLQLLDEKGREVASYIESHHVRFRTLSDYINLFKYRGSL